MPAKNQTGRLLLILTLLSSTAWGQIEFSNPRVTELAEMGITRPQGIAYHPERQTLFVVTTSEIFELTAVGDVLNSFSIAGWTDRAEGIAFDPLSGALLVCNGGRSIYRFNATGSILGSGLFVKLASEADASGLAVDPSNGNLWIADDEGEQIWEFDRQGLPLRSWPTKTLIPSFREPQGLGFFGSHLLVADDNGGSHSIYLLNRSGTLIQFLFDACDYEVEDPEGITALGESGVCLIADVESRMLCLDTEEAVLPQNLVRTPVSLGIEGTFVGVAATNMLASGNRIEIQGRDALGVLSLQAPLYQEVAQRGQTAFLTSELTGLSGSQFLDLRGEDGPIQGFFMAGDFNQQRLDGIGGLLQPAERLWFPLVRQTESSQTLLMLINPDGQQSVEALLEIVSAGGEVLHAVSGPLPPSGSFQGTLADLLSDGIEVEDAFARLTAPQPLQGMAFQVEGASLTALPALPEAVVRQLFSPHFFFGEGMGSTELRVLNREGQPLMISATAFLDSGQSLEASFEVAAQGLFVASLSDLLSGGAVGLTQGFLHLRPSGPEGSGSVEADFAAALTFSSAGGEARASIPLAEAGWKGTAFLHVSHSLSEGAFQGLAILNPDTEEDAEVRIEVFSPLGKSRGQARLEIDEHQRFIGLLNDEALFGADFQQAGGYLKVESSRPVIAVTLFGGTHFLATIHGQKAFP